MAHTLEVLRYDVEARARKEVMDVGDTSGKRVLNGQHRSLGTTLGDRREHILKRRTR